MSTTLPSPPGFEIHGLQGPNIPPEAPLAARKAIAQQDAARDAARQVDDVHGIAARGGVLVGEANIDQDTRMLQQRTVAARRDALAFNDQQIERARSEGIDGVDADELARQLTEAVEAHNEARSERQRSVEVLTGARPDPWGRTLTGDIPTEDRPWLHWIKGHALIVVLSAMEAVPGYFTAQQMLDSTDPLNSAVVAMVLASALFGLPIVAGHTLRGPKAPLEEPTRGQRTRRFAVVGGAIGVWLVLIGALSLARADSARSAAQAGMVALDAMSLLLAVAFVGIGILIMWLHARQNPHVDAVVMYNAALVRANRRIEKLSTRITRSEAQVVMQVIQRDATNDLYDHHARGVLPQQGEQLKEVYRQEYLRAAGSPETTGAVMEGYLPDMPHPADPDDAAPGTFEGK